MDSRDLIGELERDGWVWHSTTGSDRHFKHPTKPGKVSGCETFEAAIASGREALSGHLAAMRAEGDPLPPARSLADLCADPEAMAMMEGGLIQIIAPDPAPGTRRPDDRRGAPAPDRRGG
jgi:predicted RNase H-like HicB family nuclease